MPLTNNNTRITHNDFLIYNIIIVIIDLTYLNNFRLIIINFFNKIRLEKYIL